MGRDDGLWRGVCGAVLVKVRTADQYGNSQISLRLRKAVPCTNFENLCSGKCSDVVDEGSAIGGMMGCAVECAVESVTGSVVRRVVRRAVQIEQWREAVREERTSAFLSSIQSVATR